MFVSFIQNYCRRVQIYNLALFLVMDQCNNMKQNRGFFVFLHFLTRPRAGSQPTFWKTLIYILNTLMIRKPFYYTYIYASTNNFSQLHLQMKNSESLIPVVYHKNIQKDIERLKSELLKKIRV